MKVVLYPAGQAAMEMPYGANEKYYTDSGSVVVELDQLPITKEQIDDAWAKYGTDAQAAAAVAEPTPPPPYTPADKDLPNAPVDESDEEARK